MSLKIWCKADYPQHIKELEVLKPYDKSYPAPAHSKGGTVPHLQKGDVLLCMGGNNLKCLQQQGFLPKNRTITSLREKLHYIGDGVCFVTFDADIKEFDYTSYVKFLTDINLVKRYLDTESLEPVYGEYSYVHDFDPLPYLINDKYNHIGKPVRVACDLETVGLDPFNNEAWIVSISFTVEEGYAHVVYFDGIDSQPDKDSDLWDQIHWLLNDDRINLIGANLKFDLLWMRVKWGIECTNFKFDTTLVGSLLDENRSNSLNTHTKIYAPELGGYDDPFNQNFDKGKMQEVPKEDLLPYAGGDTDATLRVANQMVKSLAQSKSQTNFYTKLLHPASRAFEDMEYNGVYIDVPYFAELQVELFSEMKRLENEAMALMPARILNKYGDEFSLTKSAIIKDFMFTHPAGLNLDPILKTEKTQAPSTAFNHLKMFEDVPEAAEFVSILKEWSSAKKTESTYVSGWLKHLRDDGKLHPVAILFRGDYGGDSGDDSGTVTGRLAFKDPAAQTLPKHTAWAKKLRKGYIAPDGYVIVNWDYSQGELRVIACVADEVNMIHAYQNGIDLHLKTGAELNGYDFAAALKMKEEGDPKIAMIRQGGKAGNFGLIYGISPEGYIVYARDTYGVVLSLAEATEQQERFFDLYPGILEYHKNYKEIAHEFGRVQSPLGRVRNLPLINSTNFGKMLQSERQAINSPIQSTLSDLSQLSLSEFKKKHGNPEHCRFFMMTHDSLTAYVKEDKVDYWVPEVTSIMENLPIKKYFDWEPQLQFLTDAELGSNLAELQEYQPCPF